MKIIFNFIFFILFLLYITLGFERMCKNNFKIAIIFICDDRNITFELGFFFKSSQQAQ